MADGNGRFKIDDRVQVTRGMNRGRTGVFVGVNDIGHPLVRFSGGLVRPFDKGSLEAAGIPPISRERLAEIRAIPDEAIDTSDIPELPSGRRVRRGPSFLEAAGDPATPEPFAPTPRVFRLGDRVRVNSPCFGNEMELMGKEGVVVRSNGHRGPDDVFVLIDGHLAAIHFAPWRLDVIPDKPATPEPPAPEPSIPAGTRVLVVRQLYRDGRELQGKQGVVVDVDQVPNRKGSVFVRIDGDASAHEIEPWGLEVLPARAATPEPPAPATHKFRRGDRVRITGGEWAGRDGTIQFNEPISGGDGDWFVLIDGGPDLYQAIEECHIHGHSTGPEPVAHPWKSGDRARLSGCTASSRTWPDKDCCPVELPYGSEITLMSPADDLRWWFDHPRLGCLRTVSSDAIEPIPSGSTPPEPPAPAPAPPPTLSRLEYWEVDGDGDIAEDAEWRAAMLPIADPVVREDVRNALSILMGYSALPGRPEPDIAVIAVLGGHPVPAHAPGDRVAITHGPWEGRTMYLVRRDEVDDDSWWLAGEPGGRAWLGLRGDGFEAAGVEGGGR